MAHTFEVTFEGSMIVRLEDAVIDVVDDEWRASLYELHTPEQIAEHVAFNLIRGYRLHQLDGWADQPDLNARITDWGDIDMSAIELESEGD